MPEFLTILESESVYLANNVMRVFIPMRPPMRLVPSWPSVQSPPFRWNKLRGGGEARTSKHIGVYIFFKKFIYPSPHIEKLYFLQRYIFFKKVPFFPKPNFSGDNFFPIFRKPRNLFDPSWKWKTPLFGISSNWKCHKNVKKLLEETRECFKIATSFVQKILICTIAQFL